MMDAETHEGGSGSVAAQRENRGVGRGQARLHRPDWFGTVSTHLGYARRSRGECMDVLVCLYWGNNVTIYIWLVGWWACGVAGSGRGTETRMSAAGGALRSRYAVAV